MTNLPDVDVTVAIEVGYCGSAREEVILIGLDDFVSVPRTAMFVERDWRFETDPPGVFGISEIPPVVIFLQTLEVSELVLGLERVRFPE